MLKCKSVRALESWARAPSPPQPEKLQFWIIQLVLKLFKLFLLFPCSKGFLPMLFNFLNFFFPAESFGWPFWGVLQTRSRLNRGLLCSPIFTHCSSAIFSYLALTNVQIKSFQCSVQVSWYPFYLLFPFSQVEHLGVFSNHADFKLWYLRVILLFVYAFLKISIAGI